MRCAAHIINLVVRDGLKDVDTSVSAIRNGICYVRSSTERLKAFELKVESGKIGKGSFELMSMHRFLLFFFFFFGG